MLAPVLKHVDVRRLRGMGNLRVEEDRGLPTTELAARCGAGLAMTKAGQGDLHGFFSQIAERIPVILYDQTNEGTLEVEVLPLVDAIQRIMTVKVSGNVYSFDRLKGAAPQATYICGWDAFSLPAYVSGADGVVAGSAAVMSDREVELHRLVQAGGWDDARHLFYHRMLPMIAYCTPDPYAFSVCKHILHWKGLFDSPVVRPPYEDVPTWLQRELRELAQQSSGCSRGLEREAPGKADRSGLDTHLCKSTITLPRGRSALTRSAHQERDKRKRPAMPAGRFSEGALIPCYQTCP